MFDTKNLVVESTTLCDIRRFRRTAMTLGLAFSLLPSMAHAGVTVYTDSTAFNTAAGATRIIDFSAVPLRPGNYEDYFEFLSLSGVCIQNSYARTNVIYNFPTATMTLFAGPNTYAAGTSWFPWYGPSQTFTVKVSAGGVVSQFALSNTSDRKSVV